MKKINLLILTLSMASLFLTTNVMNAQNNHWVKLGTRVVNMHSDHDEILVTYREGSFSKIKIKVRKAPIHMFNMHIEFGNGSHEDIAINKRMNLGGDDIFGLTGKHDRIIHKISFNYKSVPSARKRAVITVWGK